MKNKAKKMNTNKSKTAVALLSVGTGTEETIFSAPGSESGPFNLH
jgi:hypothetical protein